MFSIYLSLTAFILSLLFATISSGQNISGIFASHKKLLKFNSNGKFKIVQFTDIHFGEGEDADAQTQSIMLEILKKE